MVYCSTLYIDKIIIKEMILSNWIRGTQIVCTCSSGVLLVKSAINPDNQNGEGFYS